MLFRFKWEQLISIRFVDRISDIIHPTHQEDKVELADLISSILACAGGISIASSNWNEAHRDLIAEKLLHEVVVRMLKQRFQLPHDIPGYLTDGDGYVEVHPIVDINHASEKELEDLPVIGSVLAKRIIELRQISGAFKSLQDLVIRVNGLGAETAERLRGVLYFDPYGKPYFPRIKGDFETDLKLLSTLANAETRTPAISSLLQEVLVFAATEPHPATKQSLRRSDLEPNNFTENELPLEVDGMELLPDQAYYPKLLSLIAQANKRIDVCMFFIALGGQEHPTRKILDELVEKSNSGVKVRVLVDKDREEDPYKSRIINSRAAKFLKEAGIMVKTDQTDKLLHSKFVLIDDNRTIVGSHNWTSGSYFEYQDLSIVLDGIAINDAWSNRFEVLWNQGEFV